MSEPDIPEIVKLQKLNPQPFIKIIGCGLLLIAFLVSRLYNLTILPIFLDESVHINLALKGAIFDSWLATDGTRLLLIWLLRLLLPLASDILWSGRLLSVLAGLLAAIGCYLVGKSLFNHRVGLIALALYTLNPLTLSNDRLLMTDVYLLACTVWAVWLSIELVTRPSRPLRGWASLSRADFRIFGVPKLYFGRQSTALSRILGVPKLYFGRQSTALSLQNFDLLSLGLGLVLGLVVLTKLNGLMIWVLPWLVYFLWQRCQKWAWPKGYGLAYLTAVIVSLPMFFILPQGLDVVSFQVNDQLATGASLSSQATEWGQNLGLLLSWTWHYLTPGLAVAAIGAIILLMWQRPRPGLLLLGWGLSLTLPWIFVVQPPLLTANLWLRGQVTLPGFSVVQQWYPRFILPAFPILFISLAWLFEQVWQRVGQLPHPKQRSVSLAVFIPGVALLLWPALRFDYLQLTNPAAAPFPQIDRFQYIEGYSAGYGIPEMRTLLRNEAANGEIYVAMHDRISRLMAELNVELWRGPAQPIHILSVRAGEKLPLEEFQAPLPGLPIFWLADGDTGNYKFSKVVMAHLHVEQIASFARPGNKSRVYAYLLSPKNPAMTMALEPTRPIQVNLADKMELRGYDLALNFGPAGQRLAEVTLYWRTLQPLTTDYTVFVHLIDPAGQRVAQHDGEPALGLVIPTSTWQPGEWVKDRHVLELPPDLAEGSYHLQAGVYNAQTLDRLTVLDNSLQDYVDLGRVTLQQQEGVVSSADK